MGSRSGATGFEIEPVGRGDSHGFLGLAGVVWPEVLRTRYVAQEAQAVYVSCVAQMRVPASIMRADRWAVDKQHSTMQENRGEEEEAGLAWVAFFLLLLTDRWQALLEEDCSCRVAAGVSGSQAQRRMPLASLPSHRPVQARPTAALLWSASPSQPPARQRISLDPATNSATAAAASGLGCTRFMDPRLGPSHLAAMELGPRGAGRAPCPSGEGGKGRGGGCRRVRWEQDPTWHSQTDRVGRNYPVQNPYDTSFCPSYQFTSEHPQFGRWARLRREAPPRRPRVRD